MPTPNHPKLPQCSQFAAHPYHQVFAFWLDAMITDQPKEIRQGDAYRLKGMLSAYLELGLICSAQNQAMYDELTAFAFGASA